MCAFNSTWYRKSRPFLDKATTFIENVAPAGATSYGPLNIGTGNSQGSLNIACTLGAGASAVFTLSGSADAAGTDKKTLATLAFSEANTSKMKTAPYDNQLESATVPLAYLWLDAVPTGPVTLTAAYLSQGYVMPGEM